MKTASAFLEDDIQADEQEQQNENVVAEETTVVPEATQQSVVSIPDPTQWSLYCQANHFAQQCHKRGQY